MRMLIHDVMYRFPALAVASMENEDFVFGSDDTIRSLRRDPLRGYYADRDDHLEDEIETEIHSRKRR